MSSSGTLGRFLINIANKWDSLRSATPFSLHIYKSVADLEKNIKGVAGLGSNQLAGEYR